MCREDPGEARPSYSEMGSGAEGCRVGESGWVVLPWAAPRGEGLERMCARPPRLRSWRGRVAIAGWQAVSAPTWSGSVRRVGVGLDEALRVGASLARL